MAEFIQFVKSMFSDIFGPLDPWARVLYVAAFLAFYCWDDTRIRERYESCGFLGAVFDIVPYICKIALVLLYPVLRQICEGGAL